MGEGQFGGDGSVNWDIDTADDNQSKYKHQAPFGATKGRKVSGVDETFGDNFVVSVKPKGVSAAEFKKQLENGGLTIVGDYVVLRVQIDPKEHRQVVVSWKQEPYTAAR